MVESKKDPAFSGGDLGGKPRLLVSRANAKQAADSFTRSSPDFKTCGVESAILRMYPAFQNPCWKSRENGDYGSLISIFVEINTKDFRSIVADVNQLLVKQAHVGSIFHPDLRGPGLIDKMGNPDCGRSNGVGMDCFVLQLRRLKAVVFAALDSIDGGRRFPMPLLIAGSENSRLRIIADVRLTKSCCNHFVGAAVRSDLDNRSVGDTPGRSNLAALCEERIHLFHRRPCPWRNSRVSAVCGTMLEKFSYQSASPFPSLSMRHTMPFRSET